MRCDLRWFLTAGLAKSSKTVKEVGLLLFSVAMERRDRYIYVENTDGADTKTVNFSELHVRAASGDRDAEKQLFALLTERFRAFAYHRVWNKEDAAELVQDSLAVIAQEYRQLEVQASFQAWAYKVLDNRILAYIKRRKNSRMDSSEAIDEVQGDAPDYELKRQLATCLGKLVTVNARYGRMLNLGYQGFTISEICERLQISRNNAYVILSRARSLLELCLQTGRIDS